MTSGKQLCCIVNPYPCARSLYTDCKGFARACEEHLGSSSELFKYYCEDHRPRRLQWIDK